MVETITQPIGFFSVPVVSLFLGHALYPLIYEEEKISILFNKQCKIDRRKFDKGFDPRTGENRRKQQTIYPKYVPPSQIEKEYKKFKTKYCIHHSLMVVCYVFFYLYS